LRRILDGLTGAHLLFQDTLFGGATAYSAPAALKEGWELARRLVQHFEDRWPGLGPGEHCDLVDEFARILGLEGWYHWEPVSRCGAMLEARPLARDASPSADNVTRVQRETPRNDEMIKRS
jgi:hypothetical protein